MNANGSQMNADTTICKFKQQYLRFSANHLRYVCVSPLLIYQAIP